MHEAGSPQRRVPALPSAIWVAISCVAHVLFLLELRGAAELDLGPRFELPDQVEFGLADVPPGGGDKTAPPPPAKKAEPKTPPKQHKAKPPPDPNAITLPTDAGVPTTPEVAAKLAALAATAHGREQGESAARSGEGTQAGALGEGSGEGLGEGSGYAPVGATIALNVDLGRMRSSALLLEVSALLDIIPEWQLLLAGSGLDPVQDFERVFVATPNLERSSVVLAVRHGLPRARLEAALSRLAADSGKPAQFREQNGYAVAPWPNRGPTERVIALTGKDQFAITRRADLTRVLDVAAALAEQRRAQGWQEKELREQGALLAMQPTEIVALWVEGVPRYVRGDVAGVPRSLRLSVHPVDQFNTELRVRGQYASTADAESALVAMEALRQALSDNAQISFLGLKSALERASIVRDGAALALDVRLTLHQTRYLLRYVTRALRPRAAVP
jgi:hypothetical protein